MQGNGGSLTLPAMRGTGIIAHRPALSIRIEVFLNCELSVLKCFSVKTIDYLLHVCVFGAVLGCG